jgi:hypothetical protein
VPTYEEVVPALRWSFSKLKARGAVTAKNLADALSVSQLPYAKMPDRLWPSVRAFRKLRSDVRIDAAGKFLRQRTGI